jgi:hypothetical protein
VAPCVFIDINDWTGQPYPTVDEAERAVLGIAARTWVCRYVGLALGGVRLRGVQVACCDY